MEGKEFYFQMMTNDDQSVTFLITPKKFYDTEGCLFDAVGAATEILPRGFNEFKPSYFTFTGRDVNIGKEMLQVLGMTEINFGLTSVKPNRSHEHEAELENEEEAPVMDAPAPEVNHGPRVNEEEFDPDEDDEEDPDDEENNDNDEPEHDEADYDDDEFHNHNPVQGEVPVIVPKIGNLHLGPGSFTGDAINPPIPPAGERLPSRPLPLPTESNDLDDLLKDAAANPETPKPVFDYKNMTTAALLRHKKVMVDTESYVEAGKIQKELEERGVKEI